MTNKFVTNNFVSNKLVSLLKNRYICKVPTKKISMEKPFVFGVATSGDNFTDREKETQRLLLNFTHGVNTILISPRRWGKTSLVKKVAQLAQTKTRKIVYLDIFSCRTESEFYRLFCYFCIKTNFFQMGRVG